MAITTSEFFDYADPVPPGAKALEAYIDKRLKDISAYQRKDITPVVRPMNEPPTSTITISLDAFFDSIEGRAYRTDIRKYAVHESWTRSLHRRYTNAGWVGFTIKEQRIPSEAGWTHRYDAILRLHY